MTTLGRQLMRCLVLSVSLVAGMACGGDSARSRRPNVEPRLRPWPSNPARPHAAPTAISPTSSSGTPIASATASARVDPPKAPPVLRVGARLESPYRFGLRPPPRSQAEYKADILDRRRWNDGGLGPVDGSVDKALGHPDPRVIVSVVKRRGGHTAANLQRLARRNYWIHAVRCYRLGAFRDQQMQGWTHLKAAISKRGKVKSARVLGTELKQPEVAPCLAEKLKKLAFASAAGGTDAWIDVRLGPGDEPQPPPQEQLDAGSGQLAPSEMLSPVEGALPMFARCMTTGLKSAPKLWGRVVLRIAVNANGRVIEAFQGESRFPAPRVLQCILGHARTLRFVRPSGGAVRFEVPLRIWSLAAEIPVPPDSN